jgi:hypothetical protein
VISLLAKNFEAMRAVVVARVLVHLLLVHHLSLIAIVVAIDEETCLRSTPLPVLPLWNVTASSS